MAGLLILAGAVLFLTKWFLAPYLFAVGAAGMAVCFLTLPTKDMEFRERRLHRFNIIASVLMICASGLMFKDMKEWIICLTIAAVLLLYSSFSFRKATKIILSNFPTLFYYVGNFPLLYGEIPPLQWGNAPIRVGKYSHCNGVYSLHNNK